MLALHKKVAKKENLMRPHQRFALECSVRGWRSCKWHRWKRSKQLSPLQRFQVHLLENMGIDEQVERGIVRWHASISTLALANWARHGDASCDCAFSSNWIWVVSVNEELKRGNVAYLVERSKYATNHRLSHIYWYPPAIIIRSRRDTIILNPIIVAFPYTSSFPLLCIHLVRQTNGGTYLFIYLIFLIANPVVCLRNWVPLVIKVHFSFVWKAGANYTRQNLTIHPSSLFFFF